MFSFKSMCPVPFDQQPLNEYLSLKKSWLFSWSLSPFRSFVFGLVYLFGIIFVCCSSMCVVLYPLSYVYNSLLVASFISNLFIFLVMIRLYLGWSYIVKRLLSATVFYEESGWYDGQVWIKTSDYLIQDRLIGLYQVMPFIVRIKHTLLVILVNFMIIYILHSIF